MQQLYGPPIVEVRTRERIVDHPKRTVRHAARLADSSASRPTGRQLREPGERAVSWVVHWLVPSATEVTVRCRAR